MGAGGRETAQWAEGFSGLKGELSGIAYKGERKKEG